MNVRHLIVIAFIVACGCSPNDGVTESREQTAMILEGNQVPGFSGCGWVIRFDNRFNAVVIPTNLVPEFQRDSLNVVLIVTNSAEPADCTTLEQDHKVDIISIRLPD